MRAKFEDLEKRIGHQFSNPSLLSHALTHSSYAYEAQLEKDQNNEVLEFLGDSVLGFHLADFLCRYFPTLSEGELSKLKSAAASTTSLYTFAKNIKLEKFIQLGKGEEKSGGRKKKTILAGAFEALVAALYLDGGVEASGKFLIPQFTDFFKKVDTEKFVINNFKSALQEHLQKENYPAPVYKTVTTKGPDHKKKFIVEVTARNEKLAKAKGSSKKDAEQKAAQKAIKNLIGRKIRPLTNDTFLMKKK